MNTLDWLRLPAVLDDGFAVRLTQALVHFLWQGAALGLLAGVAAWSLRRRSARLRYGVHVAALVLMLACLPVTFALVPGRSPEAGAQARAAFAFSMEDGVISGNADQRPRTPATGSTAAVFPGSLAAHAFRAAGRRRC